MLAAGKKISNFTLVIFLNFISQNINLYFSAMLPRGSVFIKLLFLALWTVVLAGDPPKEKR